MTLRRKKNQTKHNSPEPSQGKGGGSVPSPSSRRLKHLLNPSVLTATAIIVLGFVCYSNTFDAPFYFDDQKSIIDNPAIKNLGNIKAIWKFSPVRFITYLSFAINYHFNQLQVFGYHLVNIIIHISTSFLVYLFVLYLSILTNKQTPYWVAVFAALIFLCHPIQTQAVTYIVQRTASLATLFYILSLTCYVKARLLYEGFSTERPDAMQQIGTQNFLGSQEPMVRRGPFFAALAASLASALLAMLTKEIAFTLPVSIVMIEIFFFNASWMKRTKVWLALIPLLLGLLFLFGPPLLKRLTQFETVGELLGISRWDYLLTQVNVVCTYIRLLFLPINQNLDYDYPISHDFLDLNLLFSGLVLLVILIFAVMIYRRDRLISFGILFFFITLSIESSVIPIMDVIFEHRLYLPSIGFCIVISILYCEHISLFIMKHTNKTLGLILKYSVVGLLLIILSVLTLQRNYVWNDKITLWTDVINKSPRKFRGYYNLGNAYRENNMFDDAIRNYEMAIELNPLYHRSYDGLSYIYSQKRMYDIAKEYSIKSLNINARNSDALNRLGYIYIQTGDPETAIEYFKKAYSIRPRDIIIIKNLVLANAIFKNYTDSISILQKYLEANPTSADAHFLLATALYEDKNYSQAKYHCNLAVRYGYAVPAALIEALETISPK